jgi:hypothetical protein
VQACGALPLALRIAGAKLAARPSWPLAVMVRRITGAHGRLDELESADLSVRGCIASSYQWLPERSRRAFRLLALLGPADFAEWVAGALLGEPDAGDVISQLADRSLLTPLGPDSTGEPRYRLHDLLRDFAAERLVDEPQAEQNQALDRVFDGWLQLAMLAGSAPPPEPCPPADAHQPPESHPPAAAARSRPRVLPDQVAARLTADPVAWFTSERANLLAVVEQAWAVGRSDLARQLAAHQGAFLHSQSRQDDAAP